MARTVLVTGSSRGIGKGIALEFAKNGYNVVVNFLNKYELAEKTAMELSAFCNCITVQGDIRVEGDIKRIKQAACSAFGFVDTVVNNAGVAKSGLAIDFLTADYDCVMDTNLKGAFLVAREFLPDMVTNGFGRIVNISSILGQVGASCEAVYSASKAGLIGLTKALSKEYSPSGVTVNAVAPGLIDTDMIGDLSIETRGELLKNIMCGRIGQAKDVASAVLFLAKSESSYISGQVLGVNGEWGLV